MSDRALWESLNHWRFLDAEYVDTANATLYLGMHHKAFLRIAKQYSIRPDATIGKSNLYRRATLDKLHALRKPAGRPVRIVTALDES